MSAIGSKRPSDARGGWLPRQSCAGSVLRFGLDPVGESEWRDLLTLHRAVDEVLTDRQCRIFVAIALNGVQL